MKLDLSCPIEMRGYSLSYVNGMPEASVRLYNLTNRRIASFQAIAKWHSRVSEKSIAMPFSAERLRAGGENGFKINLTCNRLADADQLELVFTSVQFEDGDGWRAGEGLIVEIAPLEAISAADLAALRSIAGEDAVCFPKQDAQTWRCVCGRVNPNSADSCARCHRDQHISLGNSPENVHFLAKAIHPAEPDFNDDDALSELHSSYLRQRAKLFRRTLATAIVALALTALLVMTYQPVDASSANAEAIHDAITTFEEE